LLPRCFRSSAQAGLVRVSLPTTMCGRPDQVVTLLLDGDPSPAAVAPSGCLAVELDQYFSDPSAPADPALVDVTVGFERVAAWAQARLAG
jgi:hypothetical protein